MHPCPSALSGTGAPVAPWFVKKMSCLNKVPRPLHISVPSSGYPLRIEARCGEPRARRDRGTGQNKLVRFLLLNSDRMAYPRAAVRGPGEPGGRAPNASCMPFFMPFFFFFFNLAPFAAVTVLSGQVTCHGCASCPSIMMCARLLSLTDLPCLPRDLLLPSGLLLAPSQSSPTSVSVPRVWRTKKYGVFAVGLSGLLRSGLVGSGIYLPS